MSLPLIIEDIEKRFKISGGTLTGNVEINKSSYPMIMIKDLGQGRRGEFIYNINEEVIISNYKDENNRSLLFLRNENNINNSLQLSRVVDGQWSNYNLYGEHNKPTANDVGALPLTGGIITGNVNFKSGVHFSGGSGGAEGGEVIFAKPPTNTRFTADIYVDMCSDSFRVFSTGHDNITKVFSMNFDSHIGGDAILHHNRMQNLYIYNNYGLIQGTTSNMSLTSFNAPDNFNNRRTFAIGNSSKMTLANSLYFIDVIDGTASTYYIYGTHNKPTPEALGAARTMYLTDADFDKLTDLGYSGKSYASASTSGWMWLGREWGKKADGTNFGFQLKMSGWDGRLYGRSFNGWGTSWSPLHEFYSTKLITKGTGASPALQENFIYLQYV